MLWSTGGELDARGEGKRLEEEAERVRDLVNRWAELCCDLRGDEFRGCNCPGHWWIRSEEQARGT